MRFPIIKVKDLSTGMEHVVGTNTHDQLDVVDGNYLVYYNLQNGESTLSDYSFIPSDKAFEFQTIVDFVSFEELENIYEEQEEKDKQRLRTQNDILRFLEGAFDDE